MTKKLNKFLTRSEFLRASQYDAQWVIENQMGLNPLWLIEWLCDELHPTQGVRLLDLGCEKGLSSIFLAQEFKV